MKNKNIRLTCTSIDCPERFSLCCHAGCTNGKKGEAHFVCQKCRKEFQSPECTSGDKIPPASLGECPWDEETKKELGCFEKPDELPMGASEWKNHGKKCQNCPV